MSTLDEALTNQGTPLGADLQTGVEAISYNQTVIFTKYVRLVLPLDGFVFWVKADLLSESALLNASAMNVVTPNQPPSIVHKAKTIRAKGSLHYVTDTNQDETETYSINQVIFTSEREIVDLNDVSPTVMYLATIDGIRFTFSSRASFYRQAQIWHYRGHAVYSDMESQIIDSLQGFAGAELVVSNSLPAWLMLNAYNPVYPTFSNLVLKLYPSFAVPANISPPFGVVHIPPDSPRPIASTATIDHVSSHFQLVADRVKITMYGFRNANAMTLLDCINQFSYDYGYFGIMNAPVVRDEKRTQTELNALSMKKTIELEVSYLQNTMREIARQLILKAIPTFLVADQPQPVGATIITDDSGVIITDDSGVILTP